ncbi:hypothetical protein ABW20_dc0109760 [Dactylellina cionopaga]|nr:hypothetical protein ABW20_dc0109760 [Dactylellina cionopaga]
MGIMLRLMFNPDYDDEFENDGDGEFNEIEEVDEFVLEPVGPWCLRMDHIPFASEPVVLGRPGHFEIRFDSNADLDAGQIVRERIENWLVLTSLASTKSLTVGQLLVGVKKILVEEISKRLTPDAGIFGKKFFVRFSGILNIPDSTTSGKILLEISFQDQCEWMEEGSDDESETATEQVRYNLRN